MSKFNEDHTAAALLGIPIFCVNRLYKTGFDAPHSKIQYKFTFNNGFGSSIVEFKDREFSGGHQYELAVIDRKGDLIYETSVTSDIERGNEYRMHDLLCQIEALDEVKSIDN